MEREGEKFSSGEREEFCSSGDDKKICSNCKKEVATANFDLHFVHCTRNQILCKLCNEHVHLSDMDDHMEIQHARVECKDCDSRMDRWELDGPHKETCCKRLVICQYCDLELPFDLLQEHLSFCGSRTDPCSMCKKFVQKKEKENHIKEKCTKRLILCTYCQTKYPFDERIAHSKCCVVNSEQDPHANEVRMTVGSSSKKLDIKNITSSQEYVTPYKCIVCGKVTPSNEFKSHYEACIENVRRSNKFPIYNEAVNKSDEHMSPSRVKTEGLSDDFACYDVDDDQAAKQKSSSDQLHATKSDNGCRSKMPHAKVLTSSLGDTVPYIHDRQEENMVSCKCNLCEADVPMNEFKGHYEACTENPRSRRQFSMYSKKMSKSNEYVSNSGKTEKSTSDPTSFENYNQATKLKPNSDQLQATKNQNPSRDDEHDVESKICSLCKSQYEVHEFKEHLQQCVIKNTQQCVCGDYVLYPELSEHQKKCPGTLFARSCKLCHVKYTINEYENHYKSCPMSVATCELCNEAFLRHELENHFCTQDSRKNKVKSKSQRFQHTSDLTVMNKVENKESESDKKTESCQYCKREFSVNHLKEHIKACFMQPIKCRHCGGTLPLDESDYHKRLCPVLSKRNKLKSEGHKLDPGDAISSLNSVEDRKVFSVLSKYQQNNQVVQSTGLFAERKYLMEDDYEYPQYQEKYEVKNDRWPEGHVQMSAQNQKSTFEPELYCEVKSCRFCFYQFDAKDLEKHMIQCGEHYAECAVCGASVKFRELKNHTELHADIKFCLFCKERYPSDEEHFLSCPVSREFREKNFSPGKFESDSYFARISTQNREEGSSQYLMHSSNRKHFQPNAETNESSDHPMEVDEPSEVQSIPEHNQAETFSSRMREVASRSSGDEGVADDLRRLSKDLFKCKLCDEEKPLDDLFMSVFSMKEISLCVNCARKIQEHKTDFAGNVYSNASSPPEIEYDPLRADVVEKNKGSVQEVKACEFCERYLPLDELHEHTESCESSIYECPKCKASLLLGEKKAHDHICNGEKLSCSGAQKGRSANNSQKKKGASGGSGQDGKKACQFCGEIPQTPIKAHEKNCGLRYQKCKKCQKSVQLRYMKNHLVDQHKEEPGSYRPPGYAQRIIGSVEEIENSANEKKQAADGTNFKVCDDCHEKISYAEILNHEKSCSMRIDTCQYCDMILPHCFKAQHVEEDCPGVSFPDGTGLGRPLKEVKRSGRPQQEDNKGSRKPWQERGKGFLTKAYEQLPKLLSSPWAHENEVHHSNKYSYLGERHGNTRSTDHRDLPAHSQNHEQQELLPCEFCGALFDVEDLIVHQSGCKPELFTGSTNPDAEENITPQDRRCDDDHAPVSRNGTANLIKKEDRHVEEPQGIKNFNIFDKHPLDYDEELSDIRVSHQTQRSDNHDFTEIGKRNVDNSNITRNGGEQPADCCKECPHLNRPELSQRYTVSKNVNSQTHLKAGPRNEEFYGVERKNKRDFQTKVEHNRDDIEEKPSHSMSVKDYVRSGNNTDSGAFTFVAKAGNSNELSDSEQDQRRYDQGGRLHQNAERSHDDQHSDDRKYAVQLKITYKEGGCRLANEDDNSEMYQKLHSIPGLRRHHKMKQNERGLQARKFFGNNKDNTDELPNYENENSVKRAACQPVFEKSDKNYDNWYFETEPVEDLRSHLAELSLEHSRGKSGSSGESEPQRSSTSKQSYLHTRSTEDSDVVSVKFGNLRSADRQSEFNLSHTKSRGCDKQYENFPPGKYPKKLVNSHYQNEKEPLHLNDQQRSEYGMSYHGYKQQETQGNNSFKGGKSNYGQNYRRPQQDNTEKKPYSGRRWK